jgi:hypothetical protein
MSATPNHKKTQFTPGKQKYSKLYLGCFDSVLQRTEYWNKWILDDSWIDIINQHFDLPLDLTFVATALHRAIGRSPKFHGIDVLGESNAHGLYKASYFERVGKKHTRLTAYYATSPHVLPQKPGGNTK